MEKVANKLKEFGLARMVIILFVMILFLLAVLRDMQMAELISDSIARIARNGVLVLALLPGIRGGIGLNFGLPLGIICGLVGMIVSMEYDITGMQGFLTALTVGILFAVVMGYFYGKLLNRVKGQEMMVGTYVGFATVSIMCVFWLAAPIYNHKLIWAVGGKGLRVTVSLDDYYLKILDNFLSFNIGDVIIPTGAILFFLLACFLISLFFRTKSGMAVDAAGSNENFARASGIKPEKTRIKATILSTVLAAVGILVYNQSFGFVQFYTAPLLMAFPIIACILIGGAALNKATIFHVIFGTIIFQTLLTIALPVTSEYIGGDISETARIIISNGIILYALVGVSAKT